MSKFRLIQIVEDRKPLTLQKKGWFFWKTIEKFTNAEAATDAVKNIKAYGYKKKRVVMEFEGPD